MQRNCMAKPCLSNDDKFKRCTFIPPFHDPTSSMVPCLSTFYEVTPFSKTVMVVLE